MAHAAQPPNKQRNTKTAFDRYGEILDNYGEGFDTDGEPFDRRGTGLRQRRETIMNAFDRYGQPPLYLRQLREFFDKSGCFEHALGKFGISPDLVFDKHGGTPMHRAFSTNAYVFSPASFRQIGMVLFRQNRQFVSTSPPVIFGSSA